MTARDRAIVLALVALLAVLTVAIGAPAFLPASSPDPFASNPGSSASSSPGPIVGYREGILGQPVSIDPLTASSQVDRDLVALVYSGLVKLGPDGTLLPDLASGWTVNAKGTQYVFTIRADARWQDGEPVTSADVAYTIAALKDPDYTGPGASSWREVTLTVIDSHTVSFDLATPVGGFLYAATQPLLPDHILDGVAPAALAQDPFNDKPIGTGPFKLVSWDATQAHLVRVAATEAPASPDPSPDRLAERAGIRLRESIDVAVGEDRCVGQAELQAVGQALRETVREPGPDTLADPVADPRSDDPARLDPRGIDRHPVL